MGADRRLVVVRGQPVRCDDPVGAIEHQHAPAERVDQEVRDVADVASGQNHPRERLVDGHGRLDRRVRLPEFLQGPAALVVQPRVLQCHCRVMTEGGEQGDVLRGEHPLLSHGGDQRAQEPIARDQRYPEHRDDAFRCDRSVDVGVVHDLGGREVVADIVGRPGSRDPPGDADIRGRVEVHAEVRADASGRGSDPQPGAVLLEDRQVGEVGVDQVVGAADDALQRLVDPSQCGETGRGVQDRDLLLPPSAAFGQLPHPDDGEVVGP